MQSFEFIARVSLSYIYRVSCIDSRREESSIDVRVGTGSHGPRMNVEGGQGSPEGGRGRGMRRRGRGSERADVSEVIEARGHPGRKSHESRASGREQCRAALLARLLPPTLPPTSSSSLSLSPSFSFLSLLSAPSSLFSIP